MSTPVMADVISKGGTDTSGGGTVSGVNEPYKGVKSEPYTNKPSNMAPPAPGGLPMSQTSGAPCPPIGKTGKGELIYAMVCQLPSNITSDNTPPAAPKERPDVTNARRLIEVPGCTPIGVTCAFRGIVSTDFSAS